MYKFCKENDCYELLEETLNIIMDYYLYYNDTRTLVPGIMNIIKNNPDTDLSFVWHNIWRVYYTEKEIV